MMTKLMTIGGVMLALFVRAFRVVASACSAVRSASIACVRGVVRVFVMLALCLSAPTAFAGDMLDKEGIAQEIREQALSGNYAGARKHLNENEFLMSEHVDFEQFDKYFQPFRSKYRWRYSGYTKYVHYDVSAFYIFVNNLEYAKVRELLNHAGMGDDKAKVEKAVNLVANKMKASKLCKKAELEECKQVVDETSDANKTILNMLYYDVGEEIDYYDGRIGECATDRCKYMVQTYITEPCEIIALLKNEYSAETFGEQNGGAEEVNPCDSLHGESVAAPPEPQADYTGLYANAGFVLASAFAPSWVDTQTFAFNEGNNFITGQSLSVPLDDFTFGATRVQVNDLTDYEFSVKWEMEF